MNGEFLELHDKLMERLDKIEDKQDKRHEDNLKTFGDLPCGAHSAKIGIIYKLIMIIVAGCIGGFFWLIRTM